MTDSAGNPIWLTHPGMTADRFLDRAPINFGVTVLRLIPAALNAGLAPFEGPPSRFSSRPVPGTLYYAPWSPEEPRWPDRRRRWLADPDRWLMQWAQRVELLRVRSGSRLPALVLDREGGGTRVEVRFVRHPRLMPRVWQQRLEDHGAAGWGLRNADVGIRKTVSRTPKLARPTVAAGKTRPEFSSDQGRWLMHWTRSWDAPWPGQSEAAYLDDLMWGRPAAQRGPLATLLHILRDNRIRASSAAIRGGHRVVCFAHWHWSQLYGAGTYRRFRGRWDGLPFGLAFRPEALLSRGVRPVIYGGDEDWQELPVAQRFRFQRAESRQGTDWREECEWRKPGDLDLSDLSPADAVVFAPADADLETLSRLSRWPIQIIEPSASQVDAAG